MLKHSRAAFSRDDVDDAKRGAPDFDLRAYARRRDLEFLDHRTPAGFRAALPGDAERQSNVLRGVLVGGAFGVLAHEGLHVGWGSETPDWGGTFYGVKVELGAGLKGLLPFGPATTGVARVPCTIAASPVPETVGVQPYLRIDTRRSAPPYVATHRFGIAELVGEKRWSAWSDPAADPDLIGALVTEPVAELLRTHSEDGLFQAVVWWGTLIVRRNGYLRSDQDLDELARGTSLIARRLREVCRERCDPQAFDAMLPAPRYERIRDPRELPPGFVPGDRWRNWSHDFANRHRLELEDPPSLHRALPSLPIPGAAMIVMRGDIPNVGPGRLVICRERDATRPAVLTATPSGATPTTAGAEQLTARGVGLRRQTADGVASIWSTDSHTGTALFDALDSFLVAAGEVSGGPRVCSSANEPDTPLAV
jgi:hypothetical protein